MRLFSLSLVSFKLLCVGGLIAMGLLLMPQSVDAGSCEEKCYQAKSNAYQKCRALPPLERAARVRCFKKADEELRRCLSLCK